MILTRKISVQKETLLVLCSVHSTAGSIQNGVRSTGRLHNKLSCDDSWSGSSLPSLLTQDVLRNIPECFHRIEARVKVKLLMAFLHLPRRVIEETNTKFSEIFEIGSHAKNEWVRVLSEVLKYYPSTGMLNVNLGQVIPLFAGVSQENNNEDR